MDNTIALQVRPPQLDSPIESQGKVLQLRQMLNADQQAQYQQQQQAQAQQDDQSYRAALQANPNGGAGLLSALAGSGNYKGHAAAVKADQDQRKGNADIDKTKADTDKANRESASHQFEMAGQLAGAWANNPGVTKQQILAGLNAAAHSGVISPEIAQAKLDEVSGLPEDPRALNGWAKNTLMQVMKAKDQFDLTTVSANTKATNDVSIANSVRSAASSRYSADSSARTAGARLAYDKEKDKSGDDAPMDPLAVRMTAQQYLAGDSGVIGNFGRGAQSARNLVKVREEIARQANAQGLNGADIAAKMAEFQGLKAGQRTAGTRSASIEIAANEAAELAPLALEASQKVARSGLLPFGKAQIMFDSNTNDPALRQFAMANNALANAYGQVMSRGGVATVSDKEHAKELLSTAFDQPSYAAAVQQLQAEIKAAQKAPKAVRKDMSNETSGRDHDGKRAGAAPTSNAKGWTLHTDASGNKAYVSPDGKQFEEVK
jgi:hypothetical protein